MEKEYKEDYPNLADARQRIMAALPIPRIEDPIMVLHANVCATDCVPVSEDGNKYESLFNTFKASGLSRPVAAVS